MAQQPPIPSGFENDDRLPQAHYVRCTTCRETCTVGVAHGCPASEHTCYDGPMNEDSWFPAPGF